MRARSWIAIAAAVSGLACADSPAAPEIPQLPPPPPPLPTYVVTGTITDEALRPMGGVSLTVPMPPQWIRGLSDDHGRFGFGGVRGSFTLWLDRVGYLPRTIQLYVIADLNLDFTLQPLTISDEVELDRTIESEVVEGADPCDRLGWDRYAPCRRFRFVAPSAGTLRIEIAWGPGPELDLTMVTPDGELYAMSHANGPTLQVLQTLVTKGAAYEIRVNSYYGGQRFRMTATLGLFP